MAERSTGPASAGRSRPRRPRADAERNATALLEAARQVFQTAGVNAPARDIAARAGVGLGTLYRRFPKRSDLVAEVFRREIDACAADGVAFAETMAPGEALDAWLHRYAAFIATKAGLAEALHSGDPAFDALPAYFRQRFEPVLSSLMQAAARAGAIRTDIPAYDLLRAIGNLSVVSGDDARAHTRRMVGLLIDGLALRRGPG